MSAVFLVLPFFTLRYNLTAHIGGFLRKGVHVPVLQYRYRRLAPSAVFLVLPCFTVRSKGPISTDIVVTSGARIRDRDTATKNNYQTAPSSSSDTSRKLRVQLYANHIHVGISHELHVVDFGSTRPFLTLLHGCTSSSAHGLDLAH